MRDPEDLKKSRARRGGLCSPRCGVLAVSAALAVGLMYVTMFATSSGRLRVAEVVQKPPFDSEKLAFLDHVIVVCGHSVLSVGSDLSPRALGQDRAWALLEYQKDRGFAAEILKHVKRGVEEAANSPTALLVFSGGQTRAQAPVSEAFSYWFAAEVNDWWGHREVRERAVLEEFARDSLENLLFSIARFREVTATYPTAFSVVSFAFKQERFEHEHAVALRLPERQFRFVGVQVDSPSRFGLTEASRIESTLARVPFATDPYGCGNDVNTAKRAARNPFVRQVPYGVTCPEIAALIDWCGPELFNGSLPWAKGPGGTGGPAEPAGAGGAAGAAGRGP